MRTFGKTAQRPPAILDRQPNRCHKILRIVYIVSLFPCWSETFIVREIAEMIQLGADVRIISLKNRSEKMIQSDAEALLRYVVYPSSGWRTLAALIGTIATNPVREIKDLTLIFQSLFRHPSALVKTLVVWWRTIGLLSTVQRTAPAHIHAHWATYPSTSAWLLSRRLQIPFSFTAHAHDIFLENHMLSEKVRRATFTVAISNFNKQYLREHVADARTASVLVVHCGVSTHGFPFLEQVTDPLRILAVGRLDEIKGFCYLIDACGLLRSKGLRFHCEIIGSGPLAHSLANQVKALGLRDCVVLLGAKKQEEVRTKLNAAGIFVLPSVVTSRGDRDGIPVALMEAMACGIPVISTRVSGIPELVEHGVTGLLADAGDAKSLATCIECLIADEKLGQALARKARQRVEDEFDIKKEARKLYDAIASGQ